MVKRASHKRQDSEQRKRQGIDPRLQALVTYLAEWAAEQDFENACAQKKDRAANKE